METLVTGPVASNHCNLYIMLLDLVLGTELSDEERGEQVWEWIQERISERRGTAGVVGTGPRTEKWGGRCKWGRQRSTETKRRPLVEDVLEYRNFYEGEGAN